MSDWTAGYVADVGYTYGYYGELNPLRSQLALLNAGVAPQPGATHCELGFGQGMSANIHAAASASTWYATDFNPSQAGFAQSVAAASGAPAYLFDEAFNEFCARTDLPDFDSIGLHGIWSWISDENRAVIVDFIRRKLKVGGVLYISYNTQPGWAAMVPMRDLLTQHSEVMGAPGQGIVSRIDGSLAFADKLMATNPTYARANPTVVERLKRLKEQNRNYLAHEYFNRDWLPMPFARMADWLAPTKLGFACSAHFLDHVDPINLTPAQLDLLKEVPDAMFRETVRDFCVNQQFRRDYWVKGPRMLSALARTEALLALRVVLVQARSDVALKVTGSLGEAALHEGVYAPVLDALADHQPRTLAELLRLMSAKPVTFAQLTQAVTLLMGTGALSMVQDGATTARAKPMTDKLNAHLLGLARGSGDVTTLASPVIGGGITMSRFGQLFLGARAQGLSQPEEWAQFAWAILKDQRQRLMKDGKPLIDEADNLAELNRQAVDCQVKQLPILKALGVVS